jgi:cyclopropane-fatty-acyl-phospholipid synthase
MRGAVAREVVREAMRRLRGGRLEIVEDGRRSAFGPEGSELRASVQVSNARAWSGLLRGSTGMGEGFVNGYWDCDDLVALTRIACRNLPPFDRWRRRIHPVVGPLQRAVGLVPRNTRSGARSNISAHYDLGNELFEAFLDEGLTYSCAYFPEPGASLERAQVAKLERICRQLRLRPEDHLVEIGTGWGSLAVHAAGEHGCRVTTTTISKEQHAYATARVRDAGLSDRITVLLRDYRDLDGRYDKLVSVEMIEAVGWQYFETFFESCSRLLAPDGLMALQAIVIGDADYETEKAARSFANKHIFPGGCLPSAGLISELIETKTDMRTIWLDDITAHYAETLRIWRHRFNAAWQDLRGRGYDERFRRLWNFYLASSEGGFREHRIRDLQLLFAKPRWALQPLTDAKADAVAIPADSSLAATKA